MKKVFIVVADGMISQIFSDTKDVSVELIDTDACGDMDDVDALNERANEVSKAYHEIEAFPYAPEDDEEEETETSMSKMRTSLVEYISIMCKDKDILTEIVGSSVMIEGAVQEIIMNIFKREYDSTQFEVLSNFLSFHLSAIHRYQTNGKRQEIWNALYAQCYEIDSNGLNEGMAELSDAEVIPFMIVTCADYLINGLEER